MSYAKLSKKTIPNQLLTEIVHKFKDGGHALDVGAGPLVDANFLLSKGFTVDAIDKDSHSDEKAREINNNNLTFHNQDIKSADLSIESYDLVYSFLTLPFIEMNNFHSVFKKVSEATKKGGYLVVSLFGDRDDWSTKTGMTFLERDQTKALFSENFHIERFIEEDKEGLTVSGDLKHWHIFSVVAKRIK